ncbi:hypothetical protein LZ30DRAFT_427412 [Colletotrichum cereale]|nr:hypothetical protein LZ30DRAFT_427412 [Colletotrichum cereale]
MNDAETRDLNHFVDLLEHCLTLNPEKRIKPADALRHPFFTSRAVRFVRRDCWDHLVLLRLTHTTELRVLRGSSCTTRLQAASLTAMRWRQSWRRWVRDNMEPRNIPQYTILLTSTSLPVHYRVSLKYRGPCSCHPRVSCCLVTLEQCHRDLDEWVDSHHVCATVYGPAWGGDLGDSAVARDRVPECRLFRLP